MILCKKEDEIPPSSQDQEYWKKVIEVMIELGKETQKQTRGLVKKMKVKDPTMPNFTLIPDSQSLMVDPTSINDIKYAKEADDDDHDWAQNECRTLKQDIKGNLDCATIPKGPKIKKRPSRKAKQLPLYFHSPFVECLTSMSTDFLKEEGLLAEYMFSHQKI